MLRLFLFFWLIFGAGLGAMMAEIAAEALMPDDEIEARSEAIKRDNLGITQEDFERKVVDAFSKERAMAHVIGTTAGALFFKEDGAKGADTASYRALEHNFIGFILRVGLKVFGKTALKTAAKTIGKKAITKTTVELEKQTAKKVVQETAKGTTKQTIKNSMSTSTKIAKEGGKHHGQLKEFLKQSPDQLKKTIKSFDKQIKQHQEWIKNPQKKVEQFSTFRKSHQENLIHHWKQDIARHKELKSIAEDILKGLI